MFDLSVVVPTHNRKDYLPDLLASLACQDYPAEHWELVIIDDGSSDGTYEFLQSGQAPSPLHLRVVRQSQSGVATARNNGARTAVGRAVLFLDDDMIASPSLVSAHARTHLEDPRAVVIGHIDTPEEGREPWVAWEDAQMMKHYEALKSGRRIPGPRDFYTGNCSVSRDLFEEISGFDTTLVRTEDVDLGYRLDVADARFYYAEAARSLHLGKHQYDKWLRNAQLYGQIDVVLAWERGHVNLQHDIFRWFTNRNPFSKSLVRLCSRWPTLEEWVLPLLHLLGRATYKTHARRISNGVYSTIYNVAYWRALIEALGPGTFWAGVSAPRTFRGELKNKSAHTYTATNH